MISVKKLFTLEPKHRYRKACQILELVEADCRNRLASANLQHTATSGLTGDRPLIKHPRVEHYSEKKCSAEKNTAEQNLLGQQTGGTFHTMIAWLEDFSTACMYDSALQTTEHGHVMLEMIQAFLINKEAASRAPLVLAENERHGEQLEHQGNFDTGYFESIIRFVNALRHSLEALYGKTPADWDFFAPLGAPLEISTAERYFFKGMRAFLEDIRSPYNVGSILRTADACGFNEVLLSGFTADPLHPRAQRTAMGAQSIIPWRRLSLQELAGEEQTIIGLELGGISIDKYHFPAAGTVLLGSEELGLSPEARALCTDIISIPMLGAKGSLNVSVAFGIVAHAWRVSLQNQGIQPVKDCYQ